MAHRSFLRTFVFALPLALVCLVGIPATVSSQAGGRPIFLPLVLGPGAPAEPAGPGRCLSPQESVLGGLINQYRVSMGLSAIPLSRSLSMVAQYHVQDMQTYYPDGDFGADNRGMTCNMHSWSGNGFWSPVCYTGDHAYAEGMWLKPQEITRGAYTGSGYENAAGYWGKDITAQDAMRMWQSSPGHNNVILEKGGWEGKNWPAMGIGISKTYAVLWFGDAQDPQGSISACP